MGTGNQSYFLQRAAEEIAAAERAACDAAAKAHRELSLRYSLKLILPEDGGASDDARPIGAARRHQPHPGPVVAGQREPTRRHG